MLLGICGTAHAQTGKRNLAQEETNRTLVLEFYDTFFNLHKVDEAAKVVAEDYIQHNPTVPDGKEPFVSYYRDFFKKTPGSRYCRQIIFAHNEMHLICTAARKERLRFA
ncbi:hypothetical protein EII23_12280 [Desulfovibrio sp. OH1186_COT-070]|nr:hypothetical protein EII24_12280 [Desulfovibrio sp. OH1209_COT-279]RRD81061.1 hypothetical protein EII23_12280 [Desulfovibrio sp. OH1186_COT-070]